MTHSHIRTGTELFRERRLLRFAGGPEAQAAPETPPATETVDKPVDPKSAFREAQRRAKDVGDKLGRMRQSLDQAKRLQASVAAGKEPTAAELARHGITDTDGDGKFQKEVDAKVAGIEAKAGEHAADLDKATQESEQHLSAIEAKGPGGQLDAAAMRFDAVMKDPQASMGEKIAAGAQALAALMAVLKGISNPASAPGGSNASPESVASSPQGKKENVRAMMKDAGKDNVADLQTEKETNLTTLQGQKGGAEALVRNSKTNLANEQAGLTTAKSALEADKENPAKKEAVRQAETNVATAEAAAKAAEQQLASLNTDIVKAEADVKLIKEVRDDSKKAAKDVGQQKDIFEAKLAALDSLPGLNDDQKQAIVDLEAVFDLVDVDVAANGLDLTMNVAPAGMDRFLRIMVKAGIDPKPMKVGAGGVIEDSAAFQAGMDQFIAKMTTAGAKPKAETPAPAAPAAPAPGGAPPV